MKVTEEKGSLYVRLSVLIVYWAVLGCGGVGDSSGIKDAGSNENSAGETFGKHDGNDTAALEPSADTSSPMDVARLAPDLGTDTTDAAASSAPPNILLIIADDLGVGASQCYDVGKDLAPTPNIESLCQRGIVFDNMWSAPICSPTRAHLLTGRYSYRTGVGDVVSPGHPGLSLDEWSIPRILDNNPGLGYSHACIGKWHVGPVGNKTHPNDMGFDHFSGLLMGAVESYMDWKETTDGETETVSEYATTRHVDQALDWLSAQQGPWFLWLALTAPHTPLHLPPADLHTYSELSGTAEDIEANGPAYFRAMIQAMDTEIGRLFAGIGEEQLENTLVIYVGDNGTSGTLIEPPYQQNRAKGSLHQGGIHVPLVIAGPGIYAAPRRTSALAHMVDLFATILDTAGASSMSIPPNVEIDGASLWPVLDGSKDSVRDWMLSELFGNAAPNKAGKTARDERYKLIGLESGAQRFYDLEVDPYEEVQLDRNSLEPDVLLRYEALRDILEGIPAD